MCCPLISPNFQPNQEFLIINLLILIYLFISISHYKCYPELWHTIVPTNGKERTGYPTQKPMGILRRIILASSNPGDVVMDFFAGSGTTGAACLELDRKFILVDNNPQALEVMAQRFSGAEHVEWHGWENKLGGLDETDL